MHPKSVRKQSSRIEDTRKGFRDLRLASPPSNAAANSMRRRAALVGLSPDLIAVTSPDRRILFWSEGAEAVTRWSSDEAMGKDFLELLGAKGDMGLEDAFQRVAAGGAWEGEFDVVIRSDSRRTLHGRWKYIQDGEDLAGSLLLLNSDVTEFKQTRPETLRAQRLDNIGALACGIAHDLNNVLAPVLIGADVLESTCQLQSQLDMVRMIRTSAQRGSQIVKQVLQFVRGEEGAKVPVDVKGLVSDVAEVMRSTLPKNVEFEVSADVDGGYVLGEPTELQQVLLNLCINARDAMPQGGKLKLAVERVVTDDVFARMAPGAKADAYMVFSVRDGGCGIPKENMERIFEPHFTTKNVGNGTGLGLATVRGIIQSHGGFVRCESVVRKGSAFFACLPAIEETEAGHAAIPELPEIRGSGELLLVVDDEPLIGELCRGVLETHGYRSVVATDGIEALTLFGQHRGEIRAVISDIAMPYMDGIALTRAIRRLAPTLPILIATGTADGALLRGMEEFPNLTLIRKPYTQRMLLGAVRRCLASEAASISS